MTQFVITVTDSSNNPVSGAQVTATWNEILAGAQKVQVNTDQDGKALFDLGTYDASVQFLATKGLASGEGSANVGIFGDTSTPDINIQLTGNIGNQVTNGLANLLDTIKADSTYLIIAGGVGGGALAAFWAISKIKSSTKV